MQNNLIMLALRYFNKNKTYSLLNILGLASGFIVFTLIILYTSHELRYDRHHENSDLIYRVYKEDHLGSYQGSNKYAVVPAPLAQAMVNEFPEVVNATRFHSHENRLIKANGKVYFEQIVHTADKQAFEIFTFKSVQGDISQFLSEANTVVLSESASLKYFGKTDVLNETIYFANEFPFKVVGVFKDVPDNSHYKFEIIFEFESVLRALNWVIDRWDNSSYYTYVQLEQGVDIEELESKLPVLREKFAAEPRTGQQESNYYLQPLNEVHFTQGVNFDMAPTSNLQKLYVFVFVAFLVLIMASANYINLATSRSIIRLKEIGVRKVIGASSAHLMRQFLFESLLMSFISLILAVLVVLVLLPGFSEFLEKPLRIDFLRLEFWIYFLLLGTIIGLISGLYPAFVLKSFKAVPALKGYAKGKKLNKGLWNGLVVFQFMISATLISSMLIITRQVDYIEDLDAGFNREDIIVMNVRDTIITNNLTLFQDQLRTISGVRQVASSLSLPNNITSNSQIRWPNMPPDLENLLVYGSSADYDFIDLYNLEIVQGRNFSRDIESDRRGVLLNESAVKALGWENPIGREVYRWGEEKGRVVGVVKDFHQHSVRLKIEPLQIFFWDNHQTLSIKLDSEIDRDETLDNIQEVFEQYSASFPFEYNYFEDIYQRQYEEDIKSSKMSTWFALLAILIGSLGLYGLASFKVDQRTKEIGIRKVLGAPFGSLFTVLTKEFVVLIGVAFFIAIPISFYFLNGWLEQFTYHVELSGWVYLMTFILLLIVSLFAISSRALKITLRNPVDSLRDL